MEEAEKSINGGWWQSVKDSMGSDVPVDTEAAQLSWEEEYWHQVCAQAAVAVLTRAPASLPSRHAACAAQGLAKAFHKEYFGAFARVWVKAASCRLCPRRSALGALPSALCPRRSALGYPLTMSPLPHRS